MTSPRAPYPIEVEFDGKTHSASYTVASKMVHLSTPYGSKSTQVGGLPAETVARMLFLGLLRDAKSKGEI
jgi:hypothetical protein